MGLASVFPIFFCKHFNVGLSVVYRYENIWRKNLKNMNICRCLAHDKAQIFRIFSYGAHTILSEQVFVLAEFVIVTNIRHEEKGAQNTHEKKGAQNTHDKKLHTKPK